MQTCKTCRKPKANLNCGLCEEDVCKNCAHVLGEDYFSFFRKIPKDLTHPIYCSVCFDDKIRDSYESYNETLEKARDIIIFMKSQTKLTGHLKRKEEPYKVENCEDQDEAILKMSFWAVQDNFNALLDIQISNKKIIVGSHKKTICDATAIPILMDPDSVRSDY